MKYIHISTVEGKTAVCFDTGLDPRSFARTKMSQSLIECGHIVFPDGRKEVWKPSGVNETNGYMRVWGPSFSGERLDTFIGDINSVASQQEALQAVTFWIRAKMLLGDTYSTLNPGAVFICMKDYTSETGDRVFPKGSVFFAPPNLSSRCLIAEATEIQVTLRSGAASSGAASSGTASVKRISSTSQEVPVYDRYSCPDLTGMDAAAFCAGVMLYKILSKIHPYQSDTTIFQDMREGVFIPPHLNAPGLNKNLCDLIQLALFLPVENKRTVSSTDIIGNLLKALTENETRIVSVSSLFGKLGTEEKIRLKKEKTRFFNIQNTVVKTKRFMIRNKHALIGAAFGLLFILFIFVSTTRSMKQRPTTEGLASDTVIIAYYEAFSSLDHIFMEACIQGADKGDINVALNLYAILRTRQAHEMSNRATFIPARLWRDNGGELPAPDVFGVTDLTIEYLAGSEEDNMIIYRANYLLWSPEEYSISRSDILTLRRDKRKNWRIVEILRTER